MAVSKALVHLPAKPHALYRFFDRTDVLLYVGVTMDLPGRVGKHRQGKPWWVEVHHISVEHFDTREEAFAAETKAIATEGPLYNVVHNKLVHAPAAGANVELDDDQSPARSLAVSILGILDPDERTYWFGLASQDFDGNEVPEDEMYRSAADMATLSLHMDRLRVRALLNALLDLLPDGDGDRIREITRERLEREDFYSATDLLIGAAEGYVNQVARTYLHSLPEAEAAEWIACAEAAGTAGTHVERWAALYAQQFKAELWVESQQLCKAPGNHGAGCPTLADHRVWFVLCPFCEWPRCDGHLVWCRRHMHEASEGRLTLPDSDLPYPIERFSKVDSAEVDPSEPAF